MALKERVLELQENKRALQSSNSAKRCSIGRKKSGKIKLNFSVIIVRHFGLNTYPPHLTNFGINENKSEFLGIQSPETHYILS